MRAIIRHFSDWTGRMLRAAQFALVGLTLMSGFAIARPAEDANAAIDRWSAAYTFNDPATVVKSYWPEAILLGTVRPVISEGAGAIEPYFTNLKLKGSGNKNAIQKRRAVVIDDNAVLVTGFYPDECRRAAARAISLHDAGDEAQR